jgi:hypothetical protein
MSCKNVVDSKLFLNLVFILKFLACAIQPEPHKTLLPGAGAANKFYGSKTLQKKQGNPFTPAKCQIQCCGAGSFCRGS